jgi:plastocyanin
VAATSRRRWYRGGAAGLVVGAALLLSACNGGGADEEGIGAAPTTAAGASGAATQTNSITISNFMFAPMSAKVAPGATVKVTNKDTVDHTLTATGGQFDTGDIGDGQSKTFTAPTKPGTYHYICNIHQYMMGTIVVR